MESNSEIFSPKSNSKEILGMFFGKLLQTSKKRIKRSFMKSSYIDQSAVKMKSFLKEKGENRNSKAYENYSQSPHKVSRSRMCLKSKCNNNSFSHKRSSIIQFSALENSKKRINNNYSFLSRERPRKKAKSKPSFVNLLRQSFQNSPSKKKQYLEIYISKGNLNLI